MNDMHESWIALDVGGANIKAAHTAGPARTLPFELWKRPDEFEACPGLSGGHVSPVRPGRIHHDCRALRLLSHEAGGCQRGPRRGPRCFPRAADRGLGRRWPVPRRFPRSGEQPGWRRRPTGWRWRRWSARLVPDGPGLLIDIGTTTTDLIPLNHGQGRGPGRTDTERLQNGELVYAGVRRTPVCALATELPHRGIPTGLAAELFASTLDVYLTLDEIPPDPKDLSTADGRPATKAAARDRLARMIGTDRDTFTETTPLPSPTLPMRPCCCVSAVAARACRATIGLPQFAIVAGSGEFLARRLAQRIIEPGGTILGLNEAWGAVASRGLCHALLVLATESERNGRDGMIVIRPVVIKVGGSLFDWPELSRL